MKQAVDFETARCAAANTANAEDASLWRWFSKLLEERRIRWCLAGDKWLVSVDHRHVATTLDFDSAIRMAKHVVELRALTGRPARDGSLDSTVQ
jgi:hypothetical protein